MLPERRAWSQPIQPLHMEMISRNYVPRGGNNQFGFIDPVTALQAAETGGSIFQKFSHIFEGLFGKDPDQSEFDSKRQQIWESFANMVDTVDGLSQQGQLSLETLSHYVGALQQLTSNFTAYYQQMRAAAGPEWTDPRYHDFFDPMQRKLNDWQYLQAQMSGGDVLPVVNPVTGEVTYNKPGGISQIFTAGASSLKDNWPMIALGVGALFLFSKSTSTLQRNPRRIRRRR